MNITLELLYDVRTHRKILPVLLESGLDALEAYFISFETIWLWGINITLLHVEQRAYYSVINALPYL